nr:hypothetical protein B0A51_08621 [Rachicladosporium sp. CCFEE 5018]
MDRLRKVWKGEDDDQAYEPLESSITGAEQDEQLSLRAVAPSSFSWIEYACFLLLGIAMLWAWNCLLAVGVYFQTRFHDNHWLIDNFQAAEISVSTITNLVVMLVLTRLQLGANYPRRIIFSLLVNMAVFTLLAVSTSIGASGNAYFVFLMLAVFSTSLATGFAQNGIFAFVSGFAEPRYMSGIMTGQAVAGVLPCIAQIVSVLSVKDAEAADQQLLSRDGTLSPNPAPSTPAVKSTAALVYFLTATAVSVATFIAFTYLVVRRRRTASKAATNTASEDDNDASPDVKQSIPFSVLFRKLRFLSAAVFVTFAVTMVFPVFTQRILSVQPPAEQPRILQPPSFIPLAFLFWNSGDLIGRLFTASPALSLVRRPRIVFALSVLRIGWVGLYHLCNSRGEGAVVRSDFFYLVVVQLLFGLTNGYLGSTCMIGASEWVDPEEREAAGGFMGLCLVSGLAVGSLGSFFAAGG